MNQEPDTPTKSLEKSRFYMKEALKEAQKAYKKLEVPVGAVVVYQDKIIARAHNVREKKQQFEGHAEFLALQKAAKKLKTWRLSGCSLYVTLEPCLMCAGALLQARVSKLSYATNDLKSGAIISIINLLELPWNHKIEIESGIFEEEASNLLSAFFKELRVK